MSAKLRMTLWCTLMVLLLSAIVFVFVLLINSNSTVDDPAGRLVKVVMRNADRIEFDRGRFEWDDVDAYKRGVYCSFYSENGTVLVGAIPEGLFLSDYPFASNSIRTIDVDGSEYYLYDTLVDMSFTCVWVRGIISTGDSSGLMHTILVLTFTLLPGILMLTIIGSWIIAKKSFKPMEQIISAANEIGDGDDLSRRLNLSHGPSEMKRLASSFDRMFQRLEHSFNTEKQFASDASHELRTPITIILAQCDRARRKDKTSEDFLASIAVIEEQCKGMSELVQQLLSLTRMQHGTDRYPLRKSDLSEFTAACCDEFIPSDARGISFRTDIEPHVEASFNSALMSRIIQNLLTNAYKYGREGGSILLKLERTKDGAVLSVTDDGIGIAKEDQQKIWQRFWQADASRGEDGGSGLGLAMVKEMSVFMGGRAEVESDTGKGSCFKIILP